MRGWATACIAAATLSGCTSYRGSKALQAIGGTVAGTGLVVSASVWTGAPTSAIDAGEWLMIVGSIVALVGWVGTHVNESPAEENARRARELETQQQISLSRQVATRMARDAVSTARSGQCASVIVTSLRVQTENEEVFETDLLGDAGVVSCLAKAKLLEKPVTPPSSGVTHRDRAWAFALTKVATQAAAAGNCEITLALQRKIQDLDVNVHDAWYARDMLIKRCLEPHSALETP